MQFLPIGVVAFRSVWNRPVHYDVRTCMAGCSCKPTTSL